MTSMKAAVSGAQITLEVTGPLTAGMVGLPVTFSFDEAWEGLSRTAVFRAGGLTMDVVGVEAAATVPWEVLCKPHCTLYVGVHGVDAEGSVVIPTLWAAAGVIQPGADPSGDESVEPSLPVYEQVRIQAQAMAQQAEANAIASCAPYAVLTDAGDGLVCPQAGRSFYLNPPMLEGKEYLTLKRFLGKPVYTKLMCLSAPAEKGNTTRVSFAVGVSNMVCLQTASVRRANGTIMTDTNILKIYANVSATGAGHLCVEYPAEAVGNAYADALVYIIVEYTK